MPKSVAEYEAMMNSILKNEKDNQNEEDRIRQEIKDDAELRFKDIWNSIEGFNRSLAASGKRISIFRSFDDVRNRAVVLGSIYFTGGLKNHDYKFEISGDEILIDNFWRGGPADRVSHTIDQQEAIISYIGILVRKMLNGSDV